MDIKTIIGMYIVAIIIAIIVIRIIKKPQKNKKAEYKRYQETTIKRPTIENIDIYPNDNELPFARKDLFTRKEYAFYKTLKPIADKYSLTIFTKIRLIDLISIDSKTRSHFYQWFNKVKSKHVDFVLCDANTLRIKLIIEVDDSSHDRPDRIQRDKFVDAVMKKTETPIIHIREWDYQILNDILSNTINTTKIKAMF